MIAGSTDLNDSLLYNANTLTHGGIGVPHNSGTCRFAHDPVIVSAQRSSGHFLEVHTVRRVGLAVNSFRDAGRPTPRDQSQLIGYSGVRDPFCGSRCRSPFITARRSSDCLTGHPMGLASLATYAGVVGAHNYIAVLAPPGSAVSLVYGIYPLGS